MGSGGRFQDEDYAGKVGGINGWLDRLVDTGAFGSRDAAIDRLIKDYEKRYLKNASPTELFILNAVATGLRLSMPESEVVQKVASALWPLPRSIARKKANKKVSVALDGLGVCSNIYLFGLEDTLHAWGKAARPKTTVGRIAKGIYTTLFKSASFFASQRRQQRSQNFGPFNVSAHYRHMKDGRTVYVKGHTRWRGKDR